MDDIDLGVLIPIGQSQWGPGTDPRELLDFAVRAEELGYSSLWVNDFLLTPRVEALTMLAATVAIVPAALAAHAPAKHRTVVIRAYNVVTSFTFIAADGSSAP